jgi:hypothetical protein
LSYRRKIRATARVVDVIITLVFLIMGQKIDYFNLILKRNVQVVIVMNIQVILKVKRSKEMKMVTKAFPLLSSVRVKYVLIHLSHFLGRHIIPFLKQLM